jgi:hypothetical protein
MWVLDPRVDDMGLDPRVHEKKIISVIRFTLLLSITDILNTSALLAHVPHLPHYLSHLGL